MHRFFDDGDKVKVTIRFRGREMAHPELGMKLMNKVQADFEEEAKVEFAPKMEGRQMIMMIAPGRRKPGGGSAKPANEQAAPQTA